MIASLLVGGRHGMPPPLTSAVQLMVADVFFLDDRGAVTTDAATLVEALDWLFAQGARVVNLSLAGPPNAVLEARIARLIKEGVVVVAAAGNDGPASMARYPAAYPNVVAVTAVDKWGRVYDRAVQGPHITVAAPGVGLHVPDSSGHSRVVSGTSYAAPYVTAAIAATYEASAASSSYPAAAIDGLTVKDLGAEGRDNVFGRGLLVAPENCAARPILVNEAAN